jgi:LacI family transcriptional regulator
MKNNREVTIYDVARALNISPSTVSRGLKDHPHISKTTRDRIKSAAYNMGYRHNKFASSLRKRKTETIGVIVPKLNSYFQATAISGIEKITNKHGYGLIISQSLETVRQELKCISTMFSSRVDGLLISLAYDTSKMDHFKILFEKNIPVVFFDRVADIQGCIRTIIDNYKAGYEVTAHLIAQGCRRIVHLGGNLLRNVYSERYRGYRQALADNGLEFDADLLIISELTNQDGIMAAHAIMKMNVRPDAVFASNDATAVAVICELKKAGIKIPEEISVAGFNNEPISQVVEPNLTTIDYPAREIGEIAANSLIEILNNSGEIRLSTVILKHKLIVRDSSLRKTNQLKSTQYYGKIT